MKTLVAVGLLLLPFNVAAQDPPGSEKGWVDTIQAMVRTDRVVFKKDAVSGKTNVALMIPAPEILTEPGKLSENGRKVLDMADTYSRQAGRKLRVLLPEDQPVGKSGDCMEPAAAEKSGLAGAYVYIFIKD